MDIDVDIDKDIDVDIDVDADVGIWLTEGVYLKSYLESFNLRHIPEFRTVGSSGKLMALSQRLHVAAWYIHGP